MLNNKLSGVNIINIILYFPINAKFRQCVFVVFAVVDDADICALTKDEEKEKKAYGKSM